MKHKRYDALKSTSYQKTDRTLEVTFGTGKLSGFIATDDFGIGPFKVKDQHFALIQKEEGRIFEVIDFEGICGLAFKKMSSNGFMPIFDNIVNQELMKRNEFSFYFTKLPDTAS